MLAGKRILLIIGGGIAAYKALDLIRRLKERGAAVTPVLTRAGTEFITPLSVPPVKIHAFVIAAADARPRSKTRCSCEVSWSDAAEPVTEMSTSGRGSRQYFSKKCESIADDVVSEMRM